MRVHIAYVAPDLEVLVGVDVADDATVDDAIRASRIAERIGSVVRVDQYAIFGKPVTGAAALSDGDRIDITRPLICDPKLVRRYRAQATGQAGLERSKRGRNR
jgi:putative ubiquitin-RnfH superfamily antitoxin RatB of RatAB toxin-antitoxin module